MRSESVYVRGLDAEGNPPLSLSHLLHIPRLALYQCLLTGLTVSRVASVSTSSLGEIGQFLQQPQVPKEQQSLSKS